MCVHRALLEYQTMFSPLEDISLTTLVGMIVTTTWHGAFHRRMHQQGIKIMAIIIMTTYVCSFLMNKQM